MITKYNAVIRTPKNYEVTINKSMQVKDIDILFLTDTMVNKFARKVDTNENIY